MTQQEVEKKPSLDEMVAHFIEKIKSQEYEIFLLPSRLPDSKFVVARKQGKAPMLILASTLEVTDNVAKDIVKEQEDFAKSTRLFADKPEDSSVHGVPVMALLQEIQNISEQIVIDKGDSSTGLFVIDKKGYRLIEFPKNTKHPFDAVIAVGKKYRPDAIIFTNGGWARSITPPHDRTGEESVYTWLVMPNGDISAHLYRTYTRNGNKIVWNDPVNDSMNRIETRIPLAWSTKQARRAA